MKAGPKAPGDACNCEPRNDAFSVCAAISTERLPVPYPGGDFSAEKGSFRPNTYVHKQQAQLLDSRPERGSRTVK